MKGDDSSQNDASSNMTYEDLKKIVEKLPGVERKKPIIAIDDKLFTWEEILDEVKRKGNYSKKILEELKELRK